VSGQIDPRGKASRLHGRLDDPWLDSVEHQLCSSEHLELIACTDIAPGEVDESVAALALHGEASEVEDSLLLNDLDINLPARLGLICPDQLGRVAPDLNPDAVSVPASSMQIAEDVRGARVRTSGRYASRLVPGRPGGHGEPRPTDRGLLASGGSHRPAPPAPPRRRPTRLCGRTSSSPGCSPCRPRSSGA
jgi:hypothetical protein